MVQITEYTRDDRGRFQILKERWFGLVFVNKFIVVLGYARERI
jgi:hypothetical protein